MMKHCHKYSCLVAFALTLGGLVAVQPATAAVVLSFTGTVTDVGSFNASLPAGVEIGAAVNGRVTYDPADATMVEVGLGERAYLFLPGTGNEITFEIGTHVWKTDLQTVCVCDEACDGDFLDLAGLSNTTVNFPENLGSGFLLLEFSDFESTYDLLNGHDLPNAPLRQIFAAQLPSHDQEVRETAALCLGIAGQATPEVLDLLFGLAQDTDAGRQACARAAVDERTKCL